MKIDPEIFALAKMWNELQGFTYDEAVRILTHLERLAKARLPDGEAPQ